MLFLSNRIMVKWENQWTRTIEWVVEKKFIGFNFNLSIIKMYLFSKLNGCPGGALHPHLSLSRMMSNVGHVM